MDKVCTTFLYIFKKFATTATITCTTTTTTTTITTITTTTTTATLSTTSAIILTFDNFASINKKHFFKITFYCFA